MGNLSSQDIKSALGSVEAIAREGQSREVLQALPVAVYTTDAEGRITYFNDAAAELWGQKPELGTNEWCGSWRLDWPDGRPMPYDQCAMAVALKENRAIRGAEAVAERPDSTRIPFLAYTAPLRDESGALTGAINTLVTITKRKRAARVSRQKTPVAQDFFTGGGEMGALMRAKDWSETPIGPVEGWSLSLRMMVSFLLANRFPLLLWWGPEYVSIYNDAYRPVLGAKHPRSLGQSVRECWAEIWDLLKPLIDTPFEGGPATWMDDLPLEVNRHGFVEETHFTIAYSPVPDETAPNGIGGVLATVHEITEKVIGERRIAALRDLGARTAEGKTAEEACAIAAQALAGHARDIPFALLYLVDEAGQRARLVGATGVGKGEAAAPVALELDRVAGRDTEWPLAEVLRSGTGVTVENLSRCFSNVPAGPWSDPPHTAVVVPIKSNIAHRLAGFLIAGASPRLKLDDHYRGFFDLAAAQIATAIANARSYEEERKRAEALAEIDRAKTPVLLEH